jgi:hypothetical protein
MAGQVLSQLSICRLQGVLANVAQKVEVTDEIAYAWKDHCDSL